MERTLVIIKPDAVAAGHEKAIQDMIREAGLDTVIAGAYFLPRATVEAHYAEHRGKPFFGDLCTFMNGSVVIMIVEGTDAVRRMRELAGTTDPNGWKPGTIRRRFGTSINRNAVHSSDSVASAEREINLFFGGEPA